MLKKITSYINKMSSELQMQFTDLQNEVTKLRAEMKRLKKQVNKLSKDPDDSKEKPLSGFAKPMKLSVELTKFLGIEKDEMMSRTNVTKAINVYVKEHSLQNPENKRELILDAKLKTIIEAKDGETVTFFNLQRYMRPHYVKQESESKEPTGKEDSAEEVTVDPKATESAPKKVKKIVKKKA